ncbi:unnamed protein product [Parnassius apollo]|uniref:(apollo) hypothetical protein n=1 Tax=Parnassius apollo TaxID=110799 RepID=A0A8S3X787_PARAO|nr:unnamed protein product [Parnassius apollo]
MDKKEEPSGAFKCKQRQEREDSKPKLTSFLVNLLQVLLEKNIFIDSNSNIVVTAVLVEKPTEEDSTIIAVEDTSTVDHVNVDDVCMAHIRVEDLEEPQTFTFFENVYDIHVQNIK